MYAVVCMACICRWACEGEVGLGLSGGGKNSDRGQGGSERKKADLWLAVRHKALNYTVQAPQE